MRLQFIFDVKLYERRSVIIFDEIQKCPEAHQAIKYLVKDGRYDYIETGSLLSIKKNVQNIVIPSEETRLTMYPWITKNSVGPWAIQLQYHYWRKPSRIVGHWGIASHENSCGIYDYTCSSEVCLRL